MSLATITRAASAPLIEITPGQSGAARHRAAWHDVRDAASLWRLCWTLAWLDIRIRYRGSILGPFWLTLSTALMVAAMGGIYATLFRIEMHEYLPFLAVSQVLWGYLSLLVTDGCQGYVTSDAMIRSVRMPFTLYAARIVARNMVVLAHNLVVIIGVDLVMWNWPGANAWAALPGIAVWLVDSLAVCVLLGALCARFRDIPPIVASVMQMAFFVTPVIWHPQLVGRLQWLLPFNPFFTLLEIVRAPLLGEIPSAAVYMSAAVSSVVLCAAAWMLFARVRARIAFWV
jgi:lipopolysaccharide transport system permease protein